MSLYQFHHARDYCCPITEKKIILLSTCAGYRNNFLSLSSLSTVKRQNVRKFLGVLLYHNHSFFLNQPSELCLDSQVSDHKFPPERDVKLQKAILTHDANHRSLEISYFEMTETLVLYTTLCIHVTQYQ